MKKMENLSSNAIPSKHRSLRTWNNITLSSYLKSSALLSKEKESHSSLE